MSEVTGVITAIAGLISSAAALIVALTPLLKRRTGGNRVNNPAAAGTPPWRAQLARFTNLFTDERDSVSRRTTTTLICASVAFGVAIALQLIARPDSVRQNSGTGWTLLVVVALLVLVGASFGVDKVWASRATPDQHALMITAGVGAVFCVAAWIISLLATVSLWT